MKRIITLILLFASQAIVQAEETRYYDVEIIVFENLSSFDRQKEIWPTSIEQTLPETVIEIGKPYPGPIPKEFTPSLTFKPLPREEYQLLDNATAIEESPSRRVLLHTAWRQPGMPADSALTVRLSQAIPAITNESLLENEGNSDSSGLLTNSLQPQYAGELQGLIKVILARYLHVDADLLLTPQLAIETEDLYGPDEQESKPTVYRLKQMRRRIRSNELHYLDHPVLGVLVMIRPYETDKKSN